MSFKINCGNGHSVQLRSRHAKDLDDNRGVYAIGELAFVSDINANDYVKSAGFAFRSDHVPSDELIQHRKNLEEQRAAKQNKSDN